VKTLRKMAIQDIQSFKVMYFGVSGKATRD